MKLKLLCFLGSIFLCSDLSRVEGPKFSGLSSKKLLDAGFKFKYGVDEMFSDAIQCCREKHYL